MRKPNIKRIIILMGLVALISHIAHSMPKSDAYIRSRIVRLSSEQGMCSGEQIRTSSGHDYIISAGHCLVLMDKNHMFHVQTEDNRFMDRKLIAEDPNSDLILIEGIPHMHGLEIADKDARFEHVRTFSHGHNYDTYTTEGVLVQDEKIQIPLDFALTEEAQKACLSKPKYRLGEFMGFIPICVMDVNETVITARIVPGSSGGATVNDHGDLIGVNSASDGNQFSFIVTLGDIQRFLSDK